MTWTWLGLAALGAGHGLNPGMGWLFAVALGMQEGRGGAVWRALPAARAGSRSGGRRRRAGGGSAGAAPCRPRYLSGGSADCSSALGTLRLCATGIRGMAGCASAFAS